MCTIFLLTTIAKTQTTRTLAQNQTIKLHCKLTNTSIRNISLWLIAVIVVLLSDHEQRHISSQRACLHVLQSVSPHIDRITPPTHVVAARDILPVVINSKTSIHKYTSSPVCVCHNTLGDTLGISVRSKHNCTPKRLLCMSMLYAVTGIVVARWRSRLKKVVCFPCTRTRAGFAHDGLSTYGEVIRAAASQTVLSV